MTAVRRRRVAEPLTTLSAQTIMIAWTIIVFVPLLWTVMSSFKSTREILASPFSLPERWGFDNYISAWTDAGIGRFFFNTLVVVGGALALTMALGAACAYALTRFEFPGRRFLRTYMLAGLTFPVFLAVVPLFFVVQQFGLLNNLAGLIVTYAAYALPFTVFFLLAFFEQLPGEIAEAAAIDGAGEWRTFFSVMLPMAGPGLSAIALLNFVGLWNQYLLPLILVTDRDKSVLTQGMQAFSVQAGFNVDYGALFAAAVMTVLPVLIVYLIFQKRLLSSVTQGALK